MLNDLVARIQKMLSVFEKPTTYGSELERYIVQRSPQDGCDVDRLAREFNQKNATRNMSGWPL